MSPALAAHLSALQMEALRIQDATRAGFSIADEPTALPTVMELFGLTTRLAERLNIGLDSVTLDRIERGE